MSEISCYSDGVYFCHDCGHSWKPSSRYLNWPIRFSFYPNTWSFFVGGYQVGADGMEQLVFVRVIGIGPFRVILGDDKYKSPVKFSNQRWVRNENG